MVGVLLTCEWYPTVGFKNSNQNWITLRGLLDGLKKLCKLSASVIGHGQIQSNPLCNFQLRDISLLQKNSRFQIIYISDVLFIAQNTAIYSEGGPKQINITGKNQNANSYTDVIIEKIYPDMETLWKYVGLPFL